MVAVSEWHEYVCFTCGSCIVSICADDVIEMRGVGGVCEMFVFGWG